MTRGVVLVVSGRQEKGYEAPLRVHTLFGTHNCSEALDRESMATPQTTLDAVIESRNRGNKKWRFQRRAGMGQEVL